MRVVCSERKERERRFCDDDDVNDDVFEKCFFFLLFSLFSFVFRLFFSFFLKIFQRLFLLVKERERVSLRVFCDTRLKIIMSYYFA